MRTGHVNQLGKLGAFVFLTLAQKAVKPRVGKQLAYRVVKSERL